MVKALGKAPRLNGKDVLAASVALGPVVRHKGVRVDVARAVCLAALEVEGDLGVCGTIIARCPWGGLEGGHAQPLLHDCRHIDLARGVAGTERGRFRKQGAVFGNHVVTGKDDVRRGLSPTGARVHVTAHEARTLPHDKRSAIGGLPHDGVRGRQVDDDRRTCQGVADGGRVGSPEVLTDLRRHDKVGHALAAQQDVGAKGRRLHLVEVKGNDDARRRWRKVTQLVELVVVGDVRLGNESQNLSTAERCGTVVELAVHAPGHAHKNERVTFLSLLCKGVEAALRGIEQGILPEEVLAGVARDAKLGEDYDLGSVCAGIAHLVNALLDIECDVCHPNLGRACGYLDESVLHGSSFYTVRWLLS